MKKYNLKVKNSDVKVFVFLDEISKGNKQNFIEGILDEIKEDKKIGFAGWKSKKGMKVNLNFKFEDGKVNYPLEKISSEEIKKIIQEVFEKIPNLLEEDIYIYVFPTDSKFVMERMSGSTGYCVWKNIIYIDIYPTKNWQESFKSSLVHEFAHAISSFYHKDKTLGNMLIFEGIAEHFKGYILNDARSPWTKAIPKKEVLKIFSDLKPHLNSTDENLYNEVFFGTGKYPLWVGYTIGYYLVEDYLKKQNNIDWSKILRMNPKDILKDINFLIT